MADKFGSPGLQDRVARLEETANAVLERIKASQAGFEKMFPRPTGSKPRNPTLEAIEYATSVADDPEAWKALIGQWRGQGYNFRQIVDEAKSYTDRNEKKLAQAMPPTAMPPEPMLPSLNSNNNTQSSDQGYTYT